MIHVLDCQQGIDQILPVRPVRSEVGSEGLWPAGSPSQRSTRMGGIKAQYTSGAKVRNLSTGQDG